mmetsp:Transcript_29806/g.48116  ORF Transcript_29806/g.48116 Transcript_29806/m.48116 type:complete len:281 (-) Transcript_29806:1029-1871(-)
MNFLNTLRVSLSLDTSYATFPLRLTRVGQAPASNRTHTICCCPSIADWCKHVFPSRSSNASLTRTSSISSTSPSKMLITFAKSPCSTALNRGSSLEWRSTTRCCPSSAPAPLPTSWPSNRRMALFTTSGPLPLSNSSTPPLTLFPPISNSFRRFSSPVSTPPSCPSSPPLCSGALGIISSTPTANTVLNTRCASSKVGLLVMKGTRRNRSSPFLKGALMSESIKMLRVEWGAVMKTTSHASSSAFQAPIVSRISCARAISLYRRREAPADFALWPALAES